MKIRKILIAGFLSLTPYTLFAMPMMDQAGYESVKESISKDGQPHVEAFFQEMKSLHGGKKSDMKALFEKQKSILTAKTFDAAAYKKQSEVIRKFHQDKMQKRQATKIKLFSSLNQADRKVMVEMMQKRYKMMHKNHKMKKGSQK